MREMSYAKLESKNHKQGFSLPCRRSRWASTRGCVAHGSGAYQPFRSNQDGTYPNSFGGDVVHRPYRAVNVSIIRKHNSRPRVTYTSGMLAMLANASVTGADMAPVLPGLAQMSRHVDRLVCC
jgi:hypothetical protein